MTTKRQPQGGRSQKILARLELGLSTMASTANLRGSFARGQEEEKGHLATEQQNKLR
jgi:hypothetical protein